MIANTNEKAQLLPQVIKLIDEVIEGFSVSGRKKLVSTHATDVQIQIVGYKDDSG